MHFLKKQFLSKNGITMFKICISSSSYFVFRYCVLFPGRLAILLVGVSLRIFFSIFILLIPLWLSFFCLLMGGGIPFDFNETMFFEFPLLGLKNTVKDIMVSHTSILMFFIFNSLIFMYIF